MQTDIHSIINTPAFRELLQEAISQELARFVKEQEERAGRVSLIERIVRVEEALLAQSEVIKALQREMDKRFEAMERRFEGVVKRFYAVDKRFEAMDARFEALQREMDKRFEAMDKRFDSLERRFSFMQWLMAGGFSFLALLITLVNFLK